MTNPLCLSQFELTGADTLTFLQGQLSADLKHVGEQAQITAICNLKGRADFVLWVSQPAPNEFTLATHPSLAAHLIQHIKKYAAFSDVKLTESGSTYLCRDQAYDQQLASNDLSSADPLTQVAMPRYQFTQQAESALSPLDLIKQGISVITDETAGLFQPQELRLNELGGVSYSKGCYLGQEVVARLWFKSAPKAWLHLLVSETPAKAGDQIAEQVQVVSQSSGYTLVVARSAAIDLLCTDHSDSALSNPTNWQFKPLPSYFKSSPARIQADN
jgi:folate-binding protein YgfZ